MFYTKGAKKELPIWDGNPGEPYATKIDTMILQHCITSNEEKQDGKGDAIMTPRQKKIDHLQNHAEHRKEVIL